MPLRSAVATFLFFLPGLASAADCPLEKAVFAEADAGYELRFSPAAPAAAVTHVFSISAGAVRLDGHVLQDEETGRPMGMALDNCPEGDATGEELRACTIWQGVLYNASANGTIDVLGLSGSAAPDAILLSGFGPSLHQSRLWPRLSSGPVPWDVFVFKACAS